MTSRDTQSRCRQFVRTGEAARLAGVSESTIIRWANAGVIRFGRTLGGHRRYSARDVRRILAGCADHGSESDQPTTATGTDG